MENAWHEALRNAASAYCHVISAICSLKEYGEPAPDADLLGAMLMFGQQYLILLLVITKRMGGPTKDAWVSEEPMSTENERAAG